MNKKRFIAIAFVFSVSLNLLFIGAIIGRTMSGAHPTMGPPAPLGWVLRNLDEDTRRKLRPGLEDQAKVVAPFREEMHQVRSELGRLLNEKDLNEAALKEALKRLRKASGEFQFTLHEHMIEILKDLEPEQRKKVFGFMMRQHREERKHKRKG